MKETNITITFPDKYNEKEILSAIIGQVDVQTFKDLGITIYVPKRYLNWYA